MDTREEFLNGVLAFSQALRSVNLNPNDALVQLSEDDGRRLEHILTQLDMFTISPQHVRGFRVAGIKFWY